MIEPVECCRCHCAPTIITAGGLWYTYCPKCSGGNVYSICGLSKDKAVVQWNDINEHRKMFQPEKKRRKQKPVAKPDPDLSTMGSRIEYVGKQPKPSYIGLGWLKGGKL